MLKKTITYEDFNGNERTDTLYFNLTQTEMVEIAIDLPDGVTEAAGDGTEIDENAAALKIIDAIGNRGVLEFIKNLILKSYGLKSEDGLRFEKSEEISRHFSQTMAFDAMIMEMMNDDVAAANFINNILPKKVVEKIAKGKNGKPVLPSK